MQTNITLNLLGMFQVYKTSQLPLAQVNPGPGNVSIRYLSFARKSFSIGLFLLNTMTRSVHREIKEMYLPLLLLVICVICSRTVTPYCFCLVSMDFLRGPEVSFELPEK